MGYNRRKNIISRSQYEFGSTLTIGFLLCTLFPLSFGKKCDCSDDSLNGHIFLNPELLKKNKVFTDLSEAPPCVPSVTSCEDACTNQLRGVPVSNMVPCCVKLKNDKFVCQCVNAIPDENDQDKCPGSDLVLKSNQIFNMSGISRFFDVEVPICGSLHNSLNIYKGKGPEEKNNARPFLEKDETGVKKVGFQFSTAQNFGSFYIVYYVEFLITCKTDPLFISDDLGLCKEGKCNTENPIVTILMDLSVLESKNKLFKNLNSQPSCDLTLFNSNQCSGSNCKSKKEPCCYSEKCMFPFSLNDKCPCPPLNGDLVLANKIQLASNAENQIYFFNKANPPKPQVFVWDLDEDLENDDLLVGKGTLKFTETLGKGSLYWSGRFSFDPFVFSGCLSEILDNMDPELVPEILKSQKF